MNWRIILITIIVLGSLGFAAFPDQVLSFFGKNENSGFSIGKKTNSQFIVTLSVIRYKGQPVSIQPVVGREKIQHFQISEQELKEIMGVEAYVENKSLIRQYKFPAVPMTIPSKGNFTHRLEKCEVIPPKN